MARKIKTDPEKSTPTFEEAAAELGEARPLDDVLRQLVKPEKKGATNNTLVAPNLKNGE